MSLQVWLPFNGSLENLGLDSLTTLNNWQTVTGYSDGKIGKAINLLGSYYAFNVPTLIDSKVFSCVFWYRQNSSSSLTDNWRKIVAFVTKADGTTTTGNLRFESSYGMTGYAVSTHSNTAYQICPSGVGNRLLVGESGVWHHVALTVDGTTITYYVDGNLHHRGAQTDGMLTGEVRVGWYNASADGWLNDLRIYDHALSQKEVKELSKGLVAHYPLNDFIGNPNLLLNTMSDAGNSHNTYDLAEYNFSESLIEGGTYTLSCKINTSSERKSVAVYHSGGMIRILFFTEAPVNETGIYVHTFTATAEMASQTGGIGHGFARVYASNKNGTQGGAAVTGTANVEWIKIEKGSIATPWIPNEADSLYSALGLDEGIIYDCSGYNHHGVSHGPVVGIDSPRYKTCTSFDGTNDYIDLGIDTWLPTEVISVAMWVYMDDWTKDHRPISCTQSGGWTLQRANDLEQFALYKANGGYCRAKTATLLSTLAPGWHHFVGTYDRYVARIYLDGVLDGTSTDGSPGTESDIFYNTNTKLFLGCEAATANPSTPYLDGKLSDIRIYATVLSAEDIKALYETSVSIDDEGNFHAYEISEV